MTLAETLRTKLGLTQQAFASLLGLSFTAVSRWENLKVPPTGLSEVLLELLEGALKCNRPEEVVRALRATDGRSIQIVRALVTLGRQDLEQVTALQLWVGEDGTEKVARAQVLEILRRP